MHAVLRALNNFQSSHQVFSQQLPVVVALSGGVDSTVLLHATQQMSYRVQAVHVNHGLQPAAIDFQTHCQALCKQFDIKLTILQLPEKLTPGSTETWAREQRYLAIYTWMLQEGLQNMILGHHINDQAETILMQLFRGSGLRGIGGMSPLAPPNIDDQRFAHFRVGRPLLDISKNQLIDYAKSYQLVAIEDPTNQDTQIRRNWIRQRFLPSVIEFYPQAEIALLQLGQFVQDHFKTVDALAADLLFQTSNENQLQLSVFRQLSDLSQTEVLRLWLRQSKIRCGRDKLLELQRQLQLPQGGIRQVASGWQVFVKQGLATLILDINSHE